MPYFPLFIDLKEKKIIVFGGGKIATRRINTLLQFCSTFTVVSPTLTAELKALVDKGVICWKPRGYQKNDCKDYDLVIAVTNKRAINHAIWQEAKQEKALVNCCDQKSECDFYFPGIAINGPIVAGVTASGSDHRLAANVTHRIQELFREEF